MLKDRAFTGDEFESARHVSHSYLIRCSDNYIGLAYMNLTEAQEDRMHCCDLMLYSFRTRRL